jgi:hypothetical protein
MDKETAIYQLKISIADSKPAIWRRVQVSASTTLAEIHEIIQMVMGWEEAHLHEFSVPPPGQTNLKTRRSHADAVRYGPFTDPLGQPFEWFNEEQGDEATITLAEVAPALKSHFLYTYDMGDNWEHDIVVEKILPSDPEGAYPICIQGERNGPLEDCGGIWGYEEMLAILADPKHEEYRERKTWLKEAFGVSSWPGEAFNLDKINKKLKRLQPRKRRVSVSKTKKAT